MTIDDTIEPEPSVGRVVAAFVAGATAPVLTAASIAWFIAGMSITSLGYVILGAVICGALLAYAPTVIAGVPLYLLLRRRLAVTPLTACTVGAGLAVIIPLIAVTARWTAAGDRLLFWNYLPIVLVAGGLGAYGGAIFFLVHEGGRARPARRKAR